jgi:hypothetical protein
MLICSMQHYRRIALSQQLAGARLTSGLRVLAAHSGPNPIAHAERHYEVNLTTISDVLPRHQITRTTPPRERVRDQAHHGIPSNSP